MSKACEAAYADPVRRADGTVHIGPTAQKHSIDVLKFAWWMVANNKIVWRVLK